MSLELRDGTAANAAAIFEVVEAAFGIPPGSEQWHSRKQLVERGRVAIVEGRTPSFTLRLGQAELLRLVLGLDTIDGVAHGSAASLRPAERTFLRDLFPIQPTASGPWG